MAANRWHFENTDAFFPWASSGSSTHALDNATMSAGYSNDIFAIGFVPRETKTLDNLRIYISAVTGSPATTEIKCSLFAANSAGDGWTAGTEIETKDIDSIATGWRTFSGFSTSLTAGTKYYLAIRNANATPASNSVTIQYSNFNTLALASGHAHVGAQIHISTSGAGSLIMTTSMGGYRIGWSDSSFVGIPAATSTATSSSYRIYGTRECGTRLTFPSTMRLPIVGVVGVLANENGNPTGNVHLRVYDGTTLLGTTNTIPDAAASYSNGRHSAYFSDVIQFEGTDLRITHGVTSGGDSSNAHNAHYLTWDSDADSMDLKPYDAELTYFDGSSWSEPEDGFCACGLLVDWTQLPASAGGLLRHPGMAGGMLG